MYLQRCTVKWYRNFNVISFFVHSDTIVRWCIFAGVHFSFSAAYIQSRFEMMFNSTQCTNKIYHLYLRMMHERDTFSISSMRVFYNDWYISNEYHKMRLPKDLTRSDLTSDQTEPIQYMLHVYLYLYMYDYVYYGIFLSLFVVAYLSSLCDLPTLVPTIFIVSLSFPFTKTHTATQPRERIHIHKFIELLTIICHGKRYDWLKSKPNDYRHKYAFLPLIFRNFIILINEWKCLMKLSHIWISCQCCEHFKNFIKSFRWHTHSVDNDKNLRKA